MFESEVKSKQTNRGVPDGELVVAREVVVVLLIVTASGLLEMSSGSWMVESAAANQRPLLLRADDQRPSQHMGMIGTFMTSSRVLETNNSCCLVVLEMINMQIIARHIV